MTEDIILLASEAIENGYSYEATLEVLREQYGLSDHELSRIYDTMKAHVWEEDMEYEKFSRDMRAILESEDIGLIQKEMAKGYSDHIRRTAPWILSGD